ncbi:MAG: hypothetical protein AAF635_07835 [Cyanobacteria bacterium P01_C01_bin.69]
MTDDKRAAALKSYILNNLLGEPHLSNKSIAKVLLGIPFDNSNGPNRARRLADNLKSVEELVKVIANVDEALTEQTDGLYLSKHTNRKIKLTAPKLTRESVIRAFQILSQLTWEERQKIGHCADDHDMLINQAMLNLAQYHDLHDQKRIMELYKASIGVEIASIESAPFESPDEMRSHIESIFGEAHRAPYLESLDEETILNLKEKAVNAVERLLFQAGTGQIRFMTVDDQDSYVRSYLTPAFLKRMVQVVSENNLLNQDFPIYLKNITINHPGPLPLPKRTERQRYSYFNKELLEMSYQSDGYTYLSAPVDKRLEQLLSQSVTQSVNEFCIRIDESEDASSQYQPFSEDVYEEIKNKIDGHVRVHFTVRSTGVGGGLSQVVRSINAALFWDVSCLQQDFFFPIAHDVMVHQEIIHKNTPSPVWSHNLVKLCRSRTIKDALWQSLESSETESDNQPAEKANVIRAYEEFAFVDPEGRGDYCEFGMFASAAKAALQARLRAVKNAGISAIAYRNSLLRREEQQHILKTAKRMVSGYPFSAFAMESYLQTELFSRLTQEAANATAVEDSFSYVVCDAYLTLVETFLSEGVYRKAHKYLAELHTRLGKSSANWIAWCKSYTGESIEGVPDKDEADSFSGVLLVRYELCIAEYFYVLDCEEECRTDNNAEYFIGVDPVKAVSSTVELAWKALDRAEQLLMVRLAKYHVINEISQATFHPYYRLLSRIYLLRARIMIVHPCTAGLFLSVAFRLPTDYPFKADYRTKPGCIQGGQLFLLERARLYAACDGDNDVYVTATAYQCWSVLMATIETDAAIEINQQGTPIQIPVEDCLPWARKLRDHALLQYEETGRRCYHEVKELSGISNAFLDKLADKWHRFSDYEIEPIPAIRETIEECPGRRILEKKGAQKNGVEEVEVLFLDMEMLSLRKGWVDSTNPQSMQAIYLFGPQSAYLFFVRGLYHLFSNDQQEFSRDKNQPSPETLAQWDKKLKECYRLFNYAWATADDGCTIEKTKERTVEKTDSECKQWKIMRYAPKSMSPIPDDHAASVWDLYPFRVAEIDDLGKVFAVACASLRLYTSEDRATRVQEIDWLLERLHREKDIADNPDCAEALKGQKRYNGHLYRRLLKCQAEIQKTIDGADGAELDLSKMKKEKTRLLEKIFSWRSD